MRCRKEVCLKLDGEEVLIEYSDLRFFGIFVFYVASGGGRTKYVVANTPERNRTIKLHQLIMGAPAGLEVDHINGNGLDNRRSNLRIVTHQINQNNLPKKAASSSRYYGVSWNKERQRWQAYFQYAGKKKNLGGYTSELEAAVAYNNAVLSAGLQNVKRMNVL